MNKAWEVLKSLHDIEEHCIMSQPSQIDFGEQLSSRKLQAEVTSEKPEKKIFYIIG